MTVRKHSAGMLTRPATATATQINLHGWYQTFAGSQAKSIQLQSDLVSAFTAQAELTKVQRTLPLSTDDMDFDWSLPHYKSILVKNCQLDIFASWPPWETIKTFVEHQQVAPFSDSYLDAA